MAEHTRLGRWRGFLSGRNATKRQEKAQPEEGRGTFDLLNQPLKGLPFSCSKGRTLAHGNLTEFTIYWEYSVLWFGPGWVGGRDTEADAVGGRWASEVDDKIMRGRVASKL